MSEIKKLTDSQKPNKVEIHGNPRPTDKEKNEGVQIVGGSDAGRKGPLKVLDRTSPVEKVEAEIHVHADRGSFKDAIEKDQ